MLLLCSSFPTITCPSRLLSLPLTTTLQRGHCLLCTARLTDCLLNLPHFEAVTDEVLCPERLNVSVLYILLGKQQVL